MSSVIKAELPRPKRFIEIEPVNDAERLIF